MTTRLPERNLDILRAVAVLCVLTDHLVRIWSDNLGPVPMSQLGAFGVYIFFVHTSLVLMPSLERLQANRSTRAHWIVAFYGRRAFRIYPLAWVAIALALLLHVPPYFIHEHHAVDPFTMPGTKQLLGNILLCQNLFGVRDILTPMWSLAIEVQMYLLLPIAFLSARRSIWLLVAVGCLGIILSFVEWHVLMSTWDVPMLWRLTVFAYAPCFMSGVLAYALLYHRNAAKTAKHPSGWPSWLLAPLLIAMLALFITSWRLGGRPWYWLVCPVLALAIPYIVEAPANAIARIAKRIATYSYGIYLLHPFAIWIAFVILRQQNPITQWTSFTLLVFTLPTAAYHLVEKPCIQFGHRLLHGPLTLAATTAAP